MHPLVPILLSGVLFLALESLWCGRAWFHPARPVDRPPAPERDPFALPAVRRRLVVLAAELARLERDPTVFARAFRTRAAQTAYEALLADLERLSAAAPTLELELASSRSRLREELEV
jgi:hypothetical protein